MKYSIKFDLAKSTGGGCPIRCRVTYQGRRVDLRLGVTVPEDLWSAELQCCHGKGKDKAMATEANAAIRDLKTRIEELFARCELIEHRAPSADDLKKLTSTKGAGCSLADVLHDYLAEKSNLQDSTAKTYYCSVGTYLEWAGNVDVSEISQATIADWVEYLIYQKKFHNSSVRLYVRQLKSILRYAAKKSLYYGDAQGFDYELTNVDKTIIFLEREELQRFMAEEPLSDKEAQVKDEFCFCCFTGLRISDMQDLQWRDIHDTYMDIVTRKTADPIRIQLNKYSMEILERRRAMESDGHVFLREKDVGHYGEVVRRIARRAGINEPVTITHYKGNKRYTETQPKWAVLSSHSARKTFVANSLRMGIAPLVVMSWTGHKNYESMKPYLKIVDELKEKSMQEFDNIFDGK